MRKAILAILAATFISGANLASAGLINWVDNWKIDNWANQRGTASGTFQQNGKVIGVTYEGHFDNIADLFSWFEGSPRPYTGNPVVDNPPTLGIRLSEISLQNTLTFSAPVEGLVFAMYSVGNSNSPATYTFNAGFTFLGEGRGNWGDGRFVENGNSLTGWEGHGVIQLGSLTSLSWTNPLAEKHHGFAIGAPATASAPVPEPATMLLFGSGMAGLVAANRRRKK